MTAVKIRQNETPTKSAEVSIFIPMFEQSPIEIATDHA
jgi:hypothetical protein